MARIHFVIPDERKEFVQDYVEDSAEYESLSQFFRVAAMKEINRDDQQEGDLGPEVHRRFDDLEDQLEGMQDQLGSIATQLQSSNDYVEDVAQEIWEILPRTPEPTPQEITSSDKSREELETQHAFAVLTDDKPSTAGQLAQRVDEDRATVTDAIEHLKSQFLPIKELVDEDGNKHYLRQEELR